MEQRRRPTRPGSIDGFLDPSARRYSDFRRRTTRQQPVEVSPRLSRRAAPSQPATVEDASYRNASYARLSGTGQSLIGAALPNPKLTGQHKTQENRRHKNGGFSRQGVPVKANKPKRSIKRKLVAVIAVFMILVIGVGGWLDWNVNKVFHCGATCGVRGVQALFSHATLNGEAQGRVNILLAGYQGKQSDEGPLTDSIMIVSINTKTHTAFTMSVPRDLWVYIPGIGNYQKINAANTVTSFNQPGYFKGGMGQLQQIIEKDFGIPIDYYALIDYTAFKDVVNAVGGITVTIKSPDPRGLYDPNVDKAHGGPVKLPNGPVKLDGIQALALALARGDSPYAYGFPQSDINREQHQRQMLVALGQKAASAGVLTNPLTIDHLFGALGSNMKTDLNLQDALRLAQLAHEITVSKVRSYGLSYAGSNPLLKTYVAPDGEDSLIPKAGVGDYSQIRNFYLQLTSNNPIVREDASVVVLNASNVLDLAHKEAGILTGKGFNVTSITDANTEHTQTMIVDMSDGKDPASLQALEKLFPGQVTTSTSSSPEAAEAKGFNANFVVILGRNWDTSTAS